MIVERLLHGYDEEEVCFALRLCPWHAVRVWQPGKPTTPSVQALLGNSVEVDEERSAFESG